MFSSLGSGIVEIAYKIDRRDMLGNSIKGLFLVPAPEDEGGQSAASLLKHYANGDLEDLPTPPFSAHNTTTSIVSWRSTLLQGELLRLVLCIYTGELTHNNFCDNIVDLCGGSDDEIILPDEIRYPALMPLAQWNQLTPIPDIVSASPGDATSTLTSSGGGTHTALTGQLWEAQAFPLDLREGYVVDTIPLKWRGDTVGVVFDIRLAVTAHRAKLMKNLQLTVSLHSHSDVPRVALANLGGSVCGDAWLMQQQATEESEAVRGIDGTKSYAAGVLRYILLDTTNDSYGQMGLNKPPKEEALVSSPSVVHFVAACPVIVVRPLGLTTALVETTMFAKVENLTDDFDLCIESVHTRSCAFNGKMVLPIVLAPHDQFCLPLHLQKDFILSHQSQPTWDQTSLDTTGNAGSRTVFPLSIKWRPAITGAHSSWAQFGADCQTATNTPLQAITIKHDLVPTEHKDIIKFNLAVLNVGDMTVDLTVFVPSTDYEEQWLQSHLENTPITTLIEEWRQITHPDEYGLLGRNAVSVTPLKRLGRISTDETITVQLEYVLLSRMDGVPKIYLKDSITSQAFVALGSVV